MGARAVFQEVVYKSRFGHRGVSAGLWIESAVQAPRKSKRETAPLAIIRGIPKPSEERMFHKDILRLDAAAEVERIAAALREQVLGQLRRRGAVVGISGGIDSAVVAALCARALGKDKVLGLFMPERHSSDASLDLGRALAATLGIDTLVEDIAPALEGLGCYQRQDEAVRGVVPDYGPGWKFKLVLPSVLDSDRLNITRLTVQNPAGEATTARLTPAAYLQLVAATNYKQRVRKMTEYYHADRLNYAVAGTPNRLEYDQGFFVKQGDGAADFKPIAHLYKTQVYQLAEYLGVPEGIRSRPPTTDTFSMPQTQEEFYFALPYASMDLCLYAKNHGLPAEVVAPVLDLTPEQVGRVYRDIEAKRRATRYLHARPLLVAPVEEI
jgi:NAD+ synthase